MRPFTSAASSGVGLGAAADTERVEARCACGARFLAKRKLAGRQVRCPECDGVMVIPSPQSAPRPSPRPSPRPAPRTATRPAVQPVSRPAPRSASTPLEPLDDILPRDDLSAPAVDPLALGAGRPLRGVRRRYFETDEEKLVVMAVCGGIGMVLLLFGLMVLEQWWRPRPVVPSTPRVAERPETNTPRATPEADTTPPEVPGGRSVPESNESPSPGRTPQFGGGGSNVAAPDATRYSYPEDSEQPNLTPTPAADSGAKPAIGRARRSLGSVTEEWFASSTRQLPPPSVDAAEQSVLAQYSWMTQLLPYLGFQKLHATFNYQRSWTDDQNIVLATTLIPDFLDPRDPRERWNGAPFGNLALTHFVGISGIDQRNVAAASLPRSDPLAGVFGYKDVARPDDITDGTSNTIMIAGAGELVGPWVANGGATVRGAREPFFDPLSGFGSKSDPKGTVVLMADGSTHFMSRKIDPDVFRGLCTIHGGEQIGVQHLGPVKDHFPTKKRP